MNKQELMSRRAYFDMVHGVTVRAIEMLTDKDLDFRPTPGMRSPRELVFHIYMQEKLLAEAAERGSFTMEAANLSNPEGQEARSALETLVTASDVRAYADACHKTAEEIFNAMSEDAIMRPVESPMGAYPAWQYFTFAYDEHWHHRGQLYTYLRLLGKEPPMLYDYR